MIIYKTHFTLYNHFLFMQCVITDLVAKPVTPELLVFL